MGGYDAVRTITLTCGSVYLTRLYQVTKGKKWSDLGRTLGYGGVPGLSTQLKNSYTRVVLPFEQFSERVKNLQLTPPPTHELKTHSNIQSVKLPVLGSSVHGDDNNSPPSSPLTDTSSPLSEPPDENEPKRASGSRSESGRPRRSPRTGSQEHLTRKPLAQPAFVTY
jgi:[histone H3]-trimethyl-L-lysine4 demethylase